MAHKFANSKFLAAGLATGLLMMSAAPLAARSLDCSATGNLTQRDMNFCATQDFNAADQDLNSAWTSVFSEIKSRDAQKDSDATKGWPAAVLEAQRSWIAFRDDHCNSVGFAYRGGTIEPLIYQLCRTELTRQRTEQIKGLIDE